MQQDFAFSEAKKLFFAVLSLYKFLGQEKNGRTV
jgi:hypothetical protein